MLKIIWLTVCMQQSIFDTFVLFDLNQHNNFVIIINLALFSDILEVAIAPRQSQKFMYV